MIDQSRWELNEGFQCDEISCTDLGTASKKTSVGEQIEAATATHSSSPEHLSSSKQLPLVSSKPLGDNSLVDCVKATLDASSTKAPPSLPKRNKDNYSLGGLMEKMRLSLDDMADDDVNWEKDIDDDLHDAAALIQAHVRGWKQRRNSLRKPHDQEKLPGVSRDNPEREPWVSSPLTKFGEPMERPKFDKKVLCLQQKIPFRSDRMGTSHDDIIAKERKLLPPIIPMGRKSLPPILPKERSSLPPIIPKERSSLPPSLSPLPSFPRPVMGLGRRRRTVSECQVSQNVEIFKNDEAAITLQRVVRGSLLRMKHRNMLHQRNVEQALQQRIEDEGNDDEDDVDFQNQLKKSHIILSALMDDNRKLKKEKEDMRGKVQQLSAQNRRLNVATLAKSSQMFDVKARFQKISREHDKLSSNAQELEEEMRRVKDDMFLAGKKWSSEKRIQKKILNYIQQIVERVEDGSDDDLMEDINEVIQKEKILDSK